MTLKFIAYIDEAGDEGFGKLRQEGTTGQSRWLAIGAAIFSKSNDLLAPSWRDEIMNLFPNKKSRDLHFRHLSHDQRVATCAILGSRQIGACVVASHKMTLLDSPKKHVFKKKGHLYNYLVRLLLERVTDAVAKKAAKDNQLAELQVVFSRRGGTDYQSMRDYLCFMRDGKEVIKPVRSINWDVLDPASIRVENHSKRAGLQIADVITSATYSALDVNRFGFIEPRYVMLLKKRFIHHNGNILGSGITLIPRLDEGYLTDEQLAFIQQFR